MLQIPDWLDHHAATRPMSLAIVTPKARLTYGQVRLASVGAAMEFKQKGVKRGQKAAIHVLNPALQLVAMVALHRLGATVCVLPQEEARRDAGLKAVNFDWLVADTDEKLSDAKHIPISLDWVAGLKPRAEQIPGGFAKPKDLSILSLSSGTSNGTIKVIGYTVEQIDTRIVSRSFGDQGTRADEKTILLANFSGQNGFQGAFSVLWAGGTVYMGWTAEAVPKVIADQRIDRLFASAPLLLRALSALEAEPADVSSLIQVYGGGDSIPGPLARRIIDKMCANLVSGFATQEVGRISMAPVARMDFRPRRVGFVMPWVEAQAVNDHDEVLPAGTEGELRFKSPCMSSGYVNDPEANKAQFRNGWFYPGDMGLVTPENVLVVSGRKSDFIVTDEGSFNPAAIDRVLAGQPALVEAAGFAIKGADGKHEIGLAVVPKGKLNQAALEKFCAESLGARAPQHIIMVPRLPRNEAGKVLRWRLAEMAAAQKAEA